MGRLGRCLDCNVLISPRRVLCETCIAKRAQGSEEEE